MVPFRGVRPVGLGLIILLVAGCATDQGSLLRPMPSTYSPKLLAGVLGSEDFDFVLGECTNYVKRSVIELGDEAIPCIAQVLHDAPNENVRRNAYSALAYAGGPKAVEILRDCYSDTGDLDILAKLCFALGSTASPADRQYLVETMERYASTDSSRDDRWYRVYSSTLDALYVLREESAIPVLDELVKRKGIESSGASATLNYIKHGYWSVPVLVNCPERDKVILAVLRSGLDYSQGGKRVHLHDVDSNRSWIRSPEGWEVAYRDDNPERLPFIGFDVFISSDGQRALCDTRQYYGPLAGTGHDHVLRRDAGEWKVVGMTMTWIS